MKGTRLAAGLAVTAALAVAVLWFATKSAPVPPRPVRETATSVVLVRPGKDLATKRRPVRDRAEARAIVEALGIDEHDDAPCPAEYVGYDVSVSIYGVDTYARRGVYVFDVWTDAGTPTVLSWSTRGCKRGPLRDRAAFERAILALRS